MAFFCRDAKKAIEKIQKKGAMPFLVGGTGLYLRALLDGIFEDVPGSGDSGKDEKFRSKLLTAQEKHGGNYLYEKLKTVDVLSATKIHPNDFRRLIRALEVFHSTGKAFSEQKLRRQGIRDNFHCRIFLLDRDREDLYARIERRVDRMVQKGILGEVKKLAKKKPGLTAPLALGFREMKGVLEGHHSLEEATQLLKKNTRHYAKRQLSWFRHERAVEKMYVPTHETPKQTATKIVNQFLESKL